MRVVLVEDQLMIRDVLRRACERDFGCEVAAECADGAGGLAAVARTSPDLVLLDLHLPDCDGLDLLDTLRLRWPALKVLVLSSRCDPFAVFRIERAHASGFIDKGGQTVELLGAALRAVAAGGVHYSPAFLAARAQRRNDPGSFDKVLSDRELTVLIDLAACLDDREIAGRLGISPETVEKHRFNLMRKLGLRSPQELLRYAALRGSQPDRP